MDSREFLSPPTSCRGVALWMLNDKLEPAEIDRQLDLMKAAGWGAVITRTFNGLLTPYLSDEWMDILERIVNRAETLGIKVWFQAGYMPSAIPDMAEAHGQFMLNRKPKDEAPAPGERTLAQDSRYRYAIYRHGHMLDMMNPAAIDDYLEKSYTRTWLSRFGKHFGKTIECIWVDEPFFDPPAIPWTDALPTRFRAQWGYDLEPKVAALFGGDGDVHGVRHHYWRTVLDLYMEAYFVRVSDWCAKHNVRFSGHLMGEDTIQNQIAWTVATMPSYPYMQLPGIDHLSGDLTWPSGKLFLLTPLQCSSAAHQSGRKEILAEMYGVSTQGITFRERKEIAQHLMSLGINYRCYHGYFYSLRGRRKRYYPPHLSHQQPWWPDTRPESDYFARVSYALRQGEPRAELLVLHPVESGFSAHDPTTIVDPLDRLHEGAEIRALFEDFERLNENLLALPRAFDYGDETIMAQLGRVDEKGLHVGDMTYRAVVLPSLITIRRTTLELLKTFTAQGGAVISAGTLPARMDGRTGDATLSAWTAKLPRTENTVESLRKALDAAVAPDVRLSVTNGDNPVRIQMRNLSEGRLYYLVNTSNARGADGELEIRTDGVLEEWDPATGAVRKIPHRVEKGWARTRLALPPLGARLILARESGKTPAVGETPPAPKLAREVRFGGPYRVTRLSPNALTLDVARYRKGKDDWQDPLPVIAIQDLLTQENYEGPITLEYRFFVDAVPNALSVAVEDPNDWIMLVNGRMIAYAGAEPFMDRGFLPVDIRHAVHAGENTLQMSRTFQPVKKSKFELADLFETHLGVELESVYLIGSFGVRGGPPSGEAKPGAIRWSGWSSLAIGKEPTLSTGELAAEAWPFYAGRMVLARTLMLERPAAGMRATLELASLDGALARIRVNGREANPIFWPPMETDITQLIQDGPNEIEIEVVGTLRNLLGPHHRPAGESNSTRARDYLFNLDGLKDPDVRKANWTDDYFVIPFGLRGDCRVKYLKE